MIHVFQPRGTGKTTELLRLAYENGCDILVTSSMMAQCVLDTAVYMGLPGDVNRNRNNGFIRIGDIRILSLQDITSPCRPGRMERPILIDELDYILERMFRQRVCGYSVTYPGPEDTEVVR